MLHDDLDLPTCSFRIKFGGGAGGHNGLRSIDALGGNEYWRLRLGIGKPPVPEFKVENWVLSKFTAGEIEEWNRISGGHVALASGCSCGVAVTNLRVQDFEEQILEYLHGRHGGRWTGISELLAGIARNAEPAGPAILEDLQRTFESFEQQHSGR